jgi:hypothetical protein
VAAATVKDFCYVTAANAAQEGRQDLILVRLGPAPPGAWGGPQASLAVVVNWRAQKREPSGLDLDDPEWTPGGVKTRGPAPWAAGRRRDQ